MSSNVRAIMDSASVCPVCLGCAVTPVQRNTSGIQQDRAVSSASVTQPGLLGKTAMILASVPVRQTLVDCGVIDV